MIPEKGPLGYEFMTYLWVIGISSWGGIASYVGKLKSGYSRFSFSELIGVICISGFVGIVTFLFCESAHINQIGSAALIGIGGHMGSRAIFLLEKTLEKVIKKWLGKNDLVN